MGPVCVPLPDSNLIDPTRFALEPVGFSDRDPALNTPAPNATYGCG
jgi:hypothetical protein